MSTSRRSFLVTAALTSACTVVPRAQADRGVADVIVVGSGVAGLAVAIHSARAGRKVLVVTKSVITAGSTAWAQGGIAAALAEDDSPAAHLYDTLVAGAGLCDETAVEVLVTEGPGRSSSCWAGAPSSIATRQGNWP